MPVPDFQTLMFPFLKFADDGQDHSISQVLDALLCNLDYLMKSETNCSLVLQRNVAFDRIGQKQKGMVSFSINQ
jgi:restriction endonuclease Mrr